VKSAEQKEKERQDRIAAEEAKERALKGARLRAEKEEEGSRGVARRERSEARLPQGGRRFSARPPRGRTGVKTG
jgi:hypothetical protein